MDVDFDADSLSVDEEQSSGPPLKKKKTAGKWRGAAIYKTKFNHSWQKKWPFLYVVKEDPHSCHCSVCNNRVSCGHQGERDIIRHIDSQSHKKNAKGLNKIQPLNLVCDSSTRLKEKVSLIGHG